MENTTSDYDDDYESLVLLCDRDDDNTLGAHLSILFYFMFFFSICFNVLVLVIIHRFEKLTTVTNIFLLNLVVSSLIFVSSLPFMAVYLQHPDGWIFGNAMCKIVRTVYYLGIYSSVLFLALLTFDRHLAVVYSLEALRMRSRRYAIVSCVVVWLVSNLACVKQMILHNADKYGLDNKTYCDEYADVSYMMELRKFGSYLQLFLFLLFPLAVIIYCYIRIAITVIASTMVTKFKTVRLIFIIVLLFFVCWTPYNIVQLMHDSGKYECERLQKLGYALHITRNLAYIYFCISPIFYTFVGTKFQNYFRLLLGTRFPCFRKYISVSQHTGTNVSMKTTPNDL